ncbi:MAG: right-handed parallel beta-helix repeat-containing protein, partial [Saprospiraceae bacterium]|nr:right-handed parallel beta-helix repeat-containing protein [Saprospiraceae bacterium]
MKSLRPSLLFSVPFLLFSTLLLGNVYFVSPQGNDNNPGTQNAPFQSWQRAHDKTQPGDTVWVRGGVYPITHGNTRGVNMVGHNGTPQKKICFWAWPGENPVLDCSGMTGSGSLYGLYFENDWWHLKGLEIRGVPMNTTANTYPDGFWGEDCENDIFENLNIHHNQGRGFGIYDASRNNLVLNCDFHHNYDFKTPDAPGGHADGGGFLYLAEGMSGNIMRGCRAWANSDDGFDFWESNSGVTIEHCWSFRNGYVPDTNTEAGNGSGFKMGQNSSGAHLLHHCLSFENRVQGFDDNLAGTPQQWYNNSAFNNGSHNFRVVAPVAHILRNNIAFPDNNSLDGAVKQDNNAWNLAFSVNSNDFLSIESTGADAPRKADGSLPDLHFLQLANNSDLIDGGANVGLPFSGNAPDLGAVENAENQGAYPQSFSPHGPGGGGFTYVPSISPHDPNHIFLNCDMGGVYRSQDGAQSWQMQHYQNMVSHVKGKVQFTSDPNILY